MRILKLSSDGKIILKVSASELVHQFEITEDYAANLIEVDPDTGIDAPIDRNQFPILWSAWKRRQEKSMNEKLE